jgi:hypothetical protein
MNHALLHKLQEIRDDKTGLRLNPDISRSAWNGLRLLAG